MVVSVTEPKLLMKMLQVTFTGGPKGAKHSHIGRAFHVAGSRFKDSLLELKARTLLGEGSAHGQQGGEAPSEL